MNKQQSVKDLYEEKYVYNGLNNGILVAPQISGSKALDLLWLKKQGDIYPEIVDKQVTDVWWWLSNLAFELYASAKKLIIVDPIFASENFNDILEQEKERAWNRLLQTQQSTAKNIAHILLAQKEIYTGIERRQHYDTSVDQKIVRNPSFAQDIQWIDSNSQDVVFFNFVLDKLYKGDNALVIEEMRKALQSAFFITKSWWKIMGVHNISSHSDEIISTLDNLLISWYHVEYDQKDKYLVFCLHKE